MAVAVGLRAGCRCGHCAGCGSWAGIADRDRVGRADLAAGEVARMGLVDRQVGRIDVCRVVVGDRGRIAAAAHGRRVDNRCRRVVGDVDRQRDRRVARAAGQDVASGAVQCGEGAVPAAAGDVGRAQACRQGVGDRDRAGCGVRSVVGDHDVVGRSVLAAGEVAVVGLVYGQVDRADDRRVGIGDRGRIAAAGGGGRVDNRCGASFATLTVRVMSGWLDPEARVSLLVQVRVTERAVPARAGDRGCGQACGQGVGDCDGAGGGARTIVAHAYRVNSAGLTLAEVAGVGLVNGEVDAFDDRRVIIGYRGRVAAARGGGRVDDRGPPRCWRRRPSG